ncbi:MAG: ABC transporter permease [Deltaproteobacteria bacterium]|nr:ABC transporter permease [Deltaproteobacteria bacterium]
MSVTGRLARRCGWALFVVWATMTIAFVVNHALPADPARMVAGPQARAAEVRKIRKKLCLNRPLHVQYMVFLSRLVHVGPPPRAPGAPKAPPQAPPCADGDDTDAEDKVTEEELHASCASVVGRLHVDLGKSYTQRRPVVTILAERLPRTVLLAIAAALVQMSLGIAAGVLAASRWKTATDRLAVGVSLLGVSAPTFITGLFLQWLFGFRLRLLPLDGFGETTAQHLVSVILPATTLGIFGAAYYTRMVRDEMLGQLGQDYVRTARAKGLSRGSVLFRHALRNALLPIVTIVGLEVGTLVGGAIVTESIFRWPGLGSLSVTAMIERDGPVIMGCVILTSLAVAFATVAVDVAYTLLDPRLREKA